MEGVLGGQKYQLKKQYYIYAFINVPMTLGLISVLHSTVGKGAMFHPGGPGSIPGWGREPMKKFLSTLFFN